MIDKQWASICIHSKCKNASFECSSMATYCRQTGGTQFRHHKRKRRDGPLNLNTETTLLISSFCVNERMSETAHMATREAPSPQARRLAWQAVPRLTLYPSSRSNSSHAPPVSCWQLDSELEAPSCINSKSPPLRVGLWA